MDYLYLEFTVSSSSHFGGRLNYKRRENTSAVCFKMKSCPFVVLSQYLPPLRLSLKNNPCFIDLPSLLLLTHLFTLTAAV